METKAGGVNKTQYESSGKPQFRGLPLLSFSYHGQRHPLAQPAEDAEEGGQLYVGVSVLYF